MARMGESGGYGDRGPARGRGGRVRARGPRHPPRRAPALSNLGPLSLVVREEPDVRKCLQILTRYEHLYNEALHIHLAETDATATIRVRLDLPQARRRQSTELAVGVLYRLMRAFLGATWQPVAVGFTHRPPRQRRSPHVLSSHGRHPAGVGRCCAGRRPAPSR